MLSISFRFSFHSVFCLLVFSSKNRTALSHFFTDRTGDIFVFGIENATSVVGELLADEQVCGKSPGG
jgi:hypothetical protein